MSSPQNDGVESARAVARDRESEFGPIHPQTLVAQDDLASKLREAGEFESASLVFEELLDKLRVQYGKDDWRAVTTEHSLGHTLHRLGDLQAARELQEHVLAIAVSLFGEESEQVKMGLINLANTLRDLEDYTSELPIRIRIVESFLHSAGSESLRVPAARSDLSATMRNLGDFESAYPLDLEILTEQERLNAEPRTLLWTKTCIAKDLYGLGKVKDSVDLYVEVFRESELQLPPDDPIRTGLEEFRTGIDKYERKKSRKRRRAG